MDLGTWAAKLAEHRREAALAALVTTFAGIGLLIDRPKGAVVEWFAVPLLAVGGALFAWTVWPRAVGAESPPPSAATRVISRLTFRGRLVPLFPAIGVGIILADAAYNLVLSATPALQTEDTIVILAAASLVGYRLVPVRYARERDFVLLFFGCLNAILVIPLLIARAYYADFERSVDLYSWIALAPETSAVLQLIGVTNTVHVVGGSTAPGLTFTPQHSSVAVTVLITTACSGIYSFGIFASAFIAFVLTEYEKLTRREWLLLGLGLCTAYVSNVLRMVVIVLVGYFTDSAETDLQNMLIAHSYAGWIIFLGWITLFWGILFKTLPGPTEPSPSLPIRRSIGAEARCGICGDFLTPLIPAARCLCGALHHETCLANSLRCPICGRAVGPKDRVVADTL